MEALKSENDAQAKLNREEFAGESEEQRALLEGFHAGLYVRVVLSEMPAEFMEHYTKNTPIILGGLLPHETALGFVQLRLKAHRWYPKRLKCFDLLIFSICTLPPLLGWLSSQVALTFLTTSLFCGPSPFM